MSSPFSVARTSLKSDLVGSVLQADHPRLTDPSPLFGLSWSPSCYIITGQKTSWCGGGNFTVREEAKRHEGDGLILFITTRCQGYKQEFHKSALIPSPPSEPQPPPTSEDSITSTLPWQGSQQMALWETCLKPVQTIAICKTEMCLQTRNHRRKFPLWGNDPSMRPSCASQGQPFEEAHIPSRCVDQAGSKTFRL